MRRLSNYGPAKVAGYSLALAGAFFLFGTALGVVLEWASPLSVGFLGGSFAGAVVAVLLVWDYNKLLWKIEAAIDVDIDRDGSVGEPEQQEQGRGKPTLPAPSGNCVLISDLLTFAKLAPDDKVGTSFRGFWSDRWPHEYWQDVMDIWAAHRCVEPHRERHKSKWLAKSYEAAAARLFGTYANRPTP